MWSAHPSSGSMLPTRIIEVLDPVLTPLGFAPGQAGSSEQHGQVIFCRGTVENIDDGCVDLVLNLVIDRGINKEIDVESDVDETTKWRIVDVRYWGFTSDRWHLDFPRDAELANQLTYLARSLPAQLA